MPKKVIEGHLSLTEKDQSLWTILFPKHQTEGSIQLKVDDVPIVRNCHCDFGTSSDTAAIVDSFRSWRKGNIFVIERKGHIPRYKNVVFTHTYRVGFRFVKITTDILVPKGSIFETKFGIDSFVLPNNWQKYRFISSSQDKLEWSQWLPISPSASNHGRLLSLSKPPLSIVFQRDDIELEVITGCDLWRWDKGIGNAQNQGEYNLIYQGDGLHLQRFVTFHEQKLEPNPRNYRFTWYLSWSQKKPKCRSSNLTPLKPYWNRKGDLDFAALSKLVNQLSPGAAVEIDLGDLEWQPSDRRIYKKDNDIKTPCFVSGGSIKRLKRVIRQLKAASNKTYPILFRGLTPGLCEKGNHVSRRGHYRHWDLPAIMDFSLWVRKTLGEEFEIVYEAEESDGPSIRNLFSTPSVVVGHGN